MTGQTLRPRPAPSASPTLRTRSWRLLEREEGRVRVEPEGWLTLIAPRQRIVNSPATAANIDAFAARYGTHEREFFEGFGGQANYFERCVEVGATVAVIGTLYELGTAADGYRDIRTVYAMRAPANGRLWISTRAAHVSR